MTASECIIRDILRLFVWFPFRWFVLLLPVSIAFSFFRFMGILHFSVRTKKKKKVCCNIREYFHADKRDILRVVKKYYINHYIDRLHIFLYPKLTSREVLQRYVHFESIEILEQALKNQRGAVLVQPHFGPVQITFLSLALHGYNTVQIGYPTDKGLSVTGRLVSYRIRLKYEAMIPARIVSADKYLGSTYKHLKKGGVVLTTGDGAGRGVFLGEHKAFKFLGKERMIPLGPAGLALKTGSAFVPVFIVPERFNKFKIVFETPIKGIHNDYEKDRNFMMENFIVVAEKYIGKYPYCWHFWDEM